MHQFLIDLYKKQKIRAIDLHFSAFIAQLYLEQLNDKNEEPKDQAKEHLIRYLSCLLSVKQSQGDSCLELQPNQNFSYVLQLESEENQELLRLLPPVEEWTLLLTQVATTLDFRNHLTPIISIVDNHFNALQIAPLVMMEQRLYLYRYWLYEKNISESISLRVKHQPFDSILLSKDLPELLTSYFNRSETDEVDWQKVATVIALSRSFSVITGGPGTGKTTTVINLLASYQALFFKKNGYQPIIRIVAPTGKAAQRLNSSIQTKLQENLDKYQGIASLLTQGGQTIHRLLGYNANRAQSTYHKQNQLMIDLLVVDEASMIDLNLFNSLLDAMPLSSQIILLGDPLQLTSVETGSVLSNICEFHELGYSLAQLQFISRMTGYTIENLQSRENLQLNAHSNAHQDLTFSDAIAKLYKSYRFDHSSSIGALAMGLQQGTLNIKEIMQLENGDSFQWIRPEKQSYQSMIKEISTLYHTYFKLVQQGANKGAEILDLFNEIRVLVALRDGDFGVVRINEAIEYFLKSEGLISNMNRSGWYPGRPIMITENNYQLGLSNGDIGITLFDAEQQQLKVYFEDYRKTSDKISESSSIRTLIPSQLSAHETCYAMTIHKSQGSEFNHTLIMLPDKVHPLLSRALLYTAITRSKEKLTIYGSEKILEYSIGQDTHRKSGLFSLLQKHCLLK